VVRVVRLVRLVRVVVPPLVRPMLLSNNFLAVSTCTEITACEKL
jgi:hypothetical protein